MTRDFDKDDLEFSRQIAGSIAKVHASAGPCPSPDLVMAAAADVDFEDRQNVLKHLEACPICKQLTRDLSDYAGPPVSAEEDRRIRAQWPDLPKRSTWQPWMLGTVAAVVLLAIALIFLRPATPPAPTGTANNKVNSTPPVTAPKKREIFVLTKAAVKIPASAVLTLRNDSPDTRAFLNDFASAIDPYRKDDFAEAVQRLSELARKYPRSTEAHYYLGVSRLLLNQTNPALEALRTAQSLTDETLRDDISWYLALALDRAGRTEDARREMETLCGRAGEYQKQSCAAVEELR